jgi:hypothetical protein
MDPGFILKGVKKVSAVARIASPELLEDKEFVRKLCYTNGLCLKYVADKFKADREVVICAVFSNGHALEFATPKLRADEEIALRSIKSKGHAMRFVDKELRNTPDFLLQALLLNGLALQHANEGMRADVNDVLLKMVKPNGPAMPSVGLVSPAWQPLDDPRYGGEGLEGMDGFWRVNNNTLVEINGMELLLADGRREKVLDRGSDWLHAVIEGKLCKGQIYDGNWLDWDDGDVWLREYVLVEALARHWQCHMPEKPGFRAVPNPFKKEMDAKAKAKPRLLAATPNPELYDLNPTEFG